MFPWAGSLFVQVGDWVSFPFVVVAAFLLHRYSNQVPKLGALMYVVVCVLDKAGATESIQSMRCALRALLWTNRVEEGSKIREYKERDR